MKRYTRLVFCTLGQPFRPFHKGLKDFSGVCIQSGVAENPFLPGHMTYVRRMSSKETEAFCGYHKRSRADFAGRAFAW
jgi:hypothetical protein